MPELSRVSTGDLLAELANRDAHLWPASAAAWARHLRVLRRLAHLNKAL